MLCTHKGLGFTLQAASDACAGFLTVGGGLILLGIFSMRQNASVCGFVYQGAAKMDIIRLTERIKQTRKLTLLELFIPFTSRSWRGGHEILIIGHRNFPFVVFRNVFLYPLQLCINKRASFRFFRKWWLTPCRRQPRMKSSSDCQPLRIE